MEIKIKRQHLLNAVNHTAKAASTKSTHPILEYVKIETVNNSLELTANNLEIGIKYVIPIVDDNIVISKEGSVCLKAKFFNDMLRKLSGEYIVIKVDENNQTSIKDQESEFNLLGLAADEFQKLPEITTDNIFDIDSDLLHNMIRQTIIATAIEENRPQLTGIKISLDKGKIVLMATDSHRLARTEKQLDINNDMNFSVIVPAKSLNELIKIIDEDKSTLQISVANNQIFISKKNFTFYSRLISGNYPDVSKILIQEYKTIIKVNRKNFIESLERTVLIARDVKHYEVKTHLKPDQIELNTNSPTVGNINEVFHIDSFEGEQFTIAFNAKYMIDALRVLENELIKIKFTTESKPFILTENNSEDYINLILPIRIN